MTIDEEVDALIDTRPGRVLLHVPYDTEALQIHPRVYRSAGTTASYAVDAGSQRMIVNSGMGFEAPHHRRLFSELELGPTSHIVTTQGHADHVGGVSQFRENGAQYVAHSNNQKCQSDDKRIQAFRHQTALTWFPDLPQRIGQFLKDYPDVEFEQDEPTPDVTFHDRLSLRVGDLDVELIHVPGGETIDSLVVWLPEDRVALVSNLFGPLFPHFPNFNTLRGDLYRFPVPYLKNIECVRDLGAKTLVTGRHLPIEGADLIEACFQRLYGAVDYVHSEALNMINSGKNPYEMMEGIQLPENLRVGEGYGKVAWAARTIFESYTGWFQRRSTAELYASDPGKAASLLAEKLPSEDVIQMARDELDAGDPASAIRLAEAVRDHVSGSSALEVILQAHEVLLTTGSENFWEHGWLIHEIKRLKSELAKTGELA